MTTMTMPRPTLRTKARRRPTAPSGELAEAAKAFLDAVRHEAECNRLKEESLAGSDEGAKARHFRAASAASSRTRRLDDRIRTLMTAAGVDSFTIGGRSFIDSRAFIGWDNEDIPGANTVILEHKTPAERRGWPKKSEAVPADLVEAAREYDRCVARAKTAFRRLTRIEDEPARIAEMARRREVEAQADREMSEADENLRKALVVHGLNAVKIGPTLYADHNRASAWISDCLTTTVVAIPIERRKGRPR
jgi:hypothetical protein